VILENASIIAASILALTKFGAFCENLLLNILVFLACFGMDMDMLSSITQLFTAIEA
jgi:hypothetical protein